MIRPEIAPPDQLPDLSDHQSSDSNCGKVAGKTGESGEAGGRRWKTVKSVSAALRRSKRWIDASLVVPRL